MVSAFDFHQGPGQEIVITGAAEDPDAQTTIRAVRSRYLPNAVIIIHEAGQAGKAIEKLIPFVESKIAINNKATAYLCENCTCKNPVTEPHEFENELDYIKSG